MLTKSNTEVRDPLVSHRCDVYKQNRQTLFRSSDGMNEMRFICLEYTENNKRTRTTTATAKAMESCVCRCAGSGVMRRSAPLADVEKEWIRFVSSVGRVRGTVRRRGQRFTQFSGFVLVEVEVFLQVGDLIGRFLQLTEQELLFVLVSLLDRDEATLVVVRQRLKTGLQFSHDFGLLDQLALK